MAVSRIVDEQDHIPTGADQRPAMIPEGWSDETARSALPAQRLEEFSFQLIRGIKTCSSVLICTLFSASFA